MPYEQDTARSSVHELCKHVGAACTRRELRPKLDLELRRQNLCHLLGGLDAAAEGARQYPGWVYLTTAEFVRNGSGTLTSLQRQLAIFIPPGW